MIKVYNKLVRDKIPEIIEKNNEKGIYTILDDENYIIELDKKLNEEIAEYQKSKDTQELADVLEVIYAICQARGISDKEIEKIRNNKRKERGNFENKIFLKTVESQL